MARARQRVENRTWADKILRPFGPSPTTPAWTRVAVAAGVLVAMGVGILIGADLWRAETSGPAQPTRVTQAPDYGLDYFAGAPQGSVSGAYVRLASTGQGE
jgi:hypothetical protein